MAEAPVVMAAMEPAHKAFTSKKSWTKVVERCEWTHRIRCQLGRRGGPSLLLGCLGTIQKVLIFPITYPNKGLVFGKGLDWVDNRSLVCGCSGVPQRFTASSMICHIAHLFHQRFTVYE